MDSESHPRKQAADEGTFYLNFDGLCEPRNPGGIATYGVVIRRGGILVLEEGGLAFAHPWSDESSNNVAEYSALIRGLDWLKTRGATDKSVVARGDSSLIINQLNGKFKVKALRIVELYNRARNLIREFGNLKVEWVDRSRNQEADLQSRIAYSKLKKKYPAPDSVGTRF